MAAVSIIIPTYNYGKYIEKAIDSVLSQTYKDYEIIVVDDGSEDATSAILKSRFPGKIQYIYQEHQGVSAARNLGINRANGKYILFLDADDYLLPDALASRVSFLEMQPSCGWVYGPWCVVNETGRDMTQQEVDALPLLFKKPYEGMIWEFLLLGGLLVPAAVMSRSTLVREAGGFREDLSVYEDHHFWIQMAAKSPIGYVQNQNVVVTRHQDSFGRINDDGYNALLTILEETQNRWPRETRSLGYRWRKRYAHVLGERGRCLVGSHRIKEGRKLLYRAILIDPLQPKHYIGFLKSCM